MTRIKMMQVKKLLAFIVSLFTFLYFSVTVFAQSEAPLVSAPGGSINSNINPTNVPQLVINLIFGTAIFLAVAYLMYGGVRWITSRGDKMGVAEARKHIIAAIVGLVVVIGTFFIIQFVFTIFGNSKDNPLQKGFTLPTLTNPNGTTDTASPSP